MQENQYYSLFSKMPTWKENKVLKLTVICLAISVCLLQFFHDSEQSDYPIENSLPSKTHHAADIAVR